MPTPIETVENVLFPTLGEQTYVDEEPEKPFHPQALTFYNEDPFTNFKGVSKTPLFETNLLLDEGADSRHRRLERKGDVLLFTRYDESGSNGVYYATGQALICEKGSDAESVFIANALADVMEDAAGPLQSAMQGMREAGFELGHATEGYLRRTIFGSATVSA